MSDPLSERLSRFTPDAADLDRDGLLFAAGRASARPNTRWQALAGVLAATQALTLTLLLWPQEPVIEPPLPSFVPTLAVEPPVSPPASSELWVLRNRALATEGELPALVSIEVLAPASPPLHAFAKLADVLLE